MIGDTVYYTNLCGVIGTSILFLVGVALALDMICSKPTDKNIWTVGNRSRKHPRSKKSGIVFAVAWLCIPGVMFYFALENYQDEELHHSQLQKLLPDEVTSIQIADHNIKERRSISSFVRALKDSQYFSVEHGGIVEEGLPCEITLISGSRYSFMLLRYLRQEGVVLDFRKPEDAKYTYSDHSYFFSNKLPEFLKQAGVELPTN